MESIVLVIYSTFHLFRYEYSKTGINRIKFRLIILNINITCNWINQGVPIRLKCYKKLIFRAHVGPPLPETNNGINYFLEVPLNW